MNAGPRFLDEEGERDWKGRSVSAGMAVGPEPPIEGADRPVLLDAEPDAPARLQMGWDPAEITPPRADVGTSFWIAAGLCTLVVSWAGLIGVSLVLTLFERSVGLGALSMVLSACGLTMLLHAGLIELRAFRLLGRVDGLRTVLGAADVEVASARARVRAWLDQTRNETIDRAAVDRMLMAAASSGELRAVMRSHVAARLRDQAAAIGRRAAIEGATLVAICPHPALEGIVAGFYGLVVIRRVARLYGLRPGFAVTIALLRRVAWTAAGTAGIDLVAQGLADHVLSSTPVLKHIVGALPGTGAVAVRLYRLATVAAEACSPV